jgi:carboxypeptidase T
MKKLDHRILSVGLAFILLSAFLAEPFSHPTRAQQSADTVIARVTISSREELSRFLALGLDLLEMRDGNDLFILSTLDQVESLRAQGWAITVDKKQTATIREQGVNTFSGGYRTVAEMRSFLESEAAQYPDLAEVVVYGQSWEKIRSGGAAGSDLFGIKLTNRQRPGPKPTFFLMAAIHARELTTSELALRLVDYLLSRYGVDGDATWLLDEHLIVIVPAANPDGRAIAEQGYYQRKNTDTNYGGGCANPPTATNQYGVDLNRNASFKFGTVNPPTEPRCGQTYPGPTASSEPETTAVENLVRSLFADQRGPLDTDPASITTTGVLLTLHSYSNLVLWPWGWTTGAAPNSADLALIGGKYASYNGFTPEQSTELYPTSGTTDDWAYGELGVAAMTFEVGPASGTCGGFFPPFSCLDGGSGGSFWPRNLPAFLYAARIARAPYQLVRGPSPESVSAANTFPDTVNLQAQFNEQFNGGQIIAAAEYYLDTPPWRGGTGIPMSPSDGSFNTTIETATATVGPLSGRHLVYVRARDANGNWGPVRGVFASGPTCAISISPAGQSFGTSGGAGGVTVTAPGACSWTAVSNDNWIFITSAGDAVGNNTVTYEVRENFAERFRVGSMAIAGQIFTVYQAGLASDSCEYKVNPTFSSFSAAGGTGSFSLIAAEECVWTVTPSTAWVTITSASSGIGNGTITYSVGSNAGATARKAIITFGDQAFTIKQKGS